MPLLWVMPVPILIQHVIIFFHFLDLDPTGKHIALGGDLDGCDPLIGGFEDVRGYNRLAERLHARGLEESFIWDIYWNNAIGVMERAVRNHKK